MDYTKNLLQEYGLIARMRKLFTSSEIFFGLVLSSVFINFLAIAFSILLLQIYDRIIPNSSIDTLIMLVTGVSIAIFLEGILRYLRTYITAWANVRFEHFASCEMINKILNANIGEIEREGEGVYLEYMNALHVVKDFHTGQLVTAIIDLPFIAVFISFIAYIAGYLVFVPLSVLAILVPITIKVSNLYADALEQRNDFNHRRLNFIISMLSGIHTVKSMALEPQMLRRYERLQKQTSTSDQKVTLFGAISGFTSFSILQLSTVFVLTFGSIMVIHGNLTIGGLAACVILTNRILLPTSRVIALLAQMHSVNVAEGQLKKIMSLHQDNQELPEFPFVSGNIRLNDVCFNYPIDSILQLNNINLTIQSGEIIGISSDSSTGKTTLLLLILGILKPIKGAVLIDGKNISHYNQQSLCQQIAYISKDGVLLNGTILENITFFREEHASKAMEICSSIGLMDDILRLVDGFDTVVGQHTVNQLSGGMIQRISIAKSLVTDPKIVLFDEANVSLDIRSDELLKSYINRQKGKSTWVIVSSRPSFLAMADRVFTISDSEVKELSHNGKSKSIQSTAITRE